MRRRPIRRGVGLLACCLLLWAGLGSGPTSRPLSPGAGFFEAGMAALEAQDYPTALTRFNEALRADPRLVRAWHGMGLASVGLDRPAIARDQLEKAYSNGVRDRSLIINLAAVSVASNATPRAVAVLTQYLAGRIEPDEPALNALATALAHSDDAFKQTAVFANAVRLYEQKNAQLESKRPGERRWGVRWMAAEEVERRVQRMQEHDAKIAAVVEEIRGLDARIARASTNNNAGGRGRGFGRWGRPDGDGGDWELMRLRGEREMKARELGWLQRTAPRPRYPRTFEMAAMDELAAPPITAPQFAAVKGEVEGEEQASAAKPPAETKPPQPDPSVKPEPTSPRPEPAARPEPVEEKPALKLTPPAPRKQSLVRYAAAFPVAPGLFVTAASAIEKMRDVQLLSGDGQASRGVVVRVEGGLALVRADSIRMAAFDLADRYAGEPVQSAALMEINVFEPRAEMIDGKVRPADDGWTVAFARTPRLPGSPLLAGGRVVGVQLAARDSKSDSVPAASLDQVKALVGRDAPAAGVAKTDPTLRICQLVVIVEQ